MKIRKYPAGVGEYRDQHGKLRVRGRRKGAATYYFKAAPGTPEFEEELRSWHDAAGSHPQIGLSRTRAGSVSDVIVRWYASRQFLGFEASTKSTFRGIAERFRAEHGEKPIALIQREHVQRILSAKAAAPGPTGKPTIEASNNLLKVLRYLMRFAVEEKMRKDDPTLGLKFIRAKSKGFHSWTDDEIVQFENAHALSTRARLALALLLFTAQRRSDVIRMGKQHVRADRIRVVQQKTDTTLEIPIHPELKDVMAASPISNMTFLVTGGGKPFTPAGFTNWFRDMCRQAGLPYHCSPHGLRKAAARRLAEAGCTANQIAAVTGHKSLREVERYTRAAEQARLADSAIATVARADQEQKLANHDERLAKTSGK
jgi:integrase